MLDTISVAVSVRSNGLPAMWFHAARRWSFVPIFAMCPMPVTLKQVIDSRARHLFRAIMLQVVALSVPAMNSTWNCLLAWHHPNGVLLISKASSRHLRFHYLGVGMKHGQLRLRRIMLGSMSSVKQLEWKATHSKRRSLQSMFFPISADKRVFG